MGTVPQGKDRGIFDPAGTVPDVSGGLTDYFQPMTFEVLTKTTVGFQVVETTTPVSFGGTIQPLGARQLALKPEGQRAWSWYQLHAEPSLELEVDDVLVWQGKQTRVMARNNYDDFGYVEYHLVQDYSGSNPTVNP